MKRGEEGVAVAELCREAGISQATDFNWKKTYAGLMPSEMKRLRELEQENAKLKKIVAASDVDKEMLQGEPCLTAIGPRSMANIKRKL